jgi:hypothetical protein
MNEVARTGVDGYERAAERAWATCFHLVAERCTAPERSKASGLCDDQKTGTSSRSKRPIAMKSAQNTQVSRGLRKEGIELGGR